MNTRSARKVRGVLSKEATMHLYALITAAATFLLLIAGGLVTSTDSGLAVPDWPLSYGMLFPPMVGGILYEHGHRMVAGVVGLMILGLAVWLGRTDARRWARRLGYGALGAVALQALLGGLTVLLLLPPQISIAHACLGQTVFCLVVGLAWCTAPGWDRAEALDLGSPAAARLALAVAVLAGLQLVLGAILRHTGSGLVWHMGNGMALVVGVVWLAWHVGRTPQRPEGLWRAVGRLLVLALLQAGVGGVVMMHRGSIPWRTGHLALGALVLAQAVLVAWDASRRCVGVPGGAAQASG